jgi:protein transport protein HofC
VTPEPAENPTSDEVSQLTDFWEADPGADPQVPEAWEAENGDGPQVIEAQEPGAEDDSGWDFDELARPTRPESWRLHHLMILIAGVAVMLWLVIALRGWVVLGLFLLLATALGSGFVWARLRASRQDSLLWILTIASQRGMPLAPAVAAFADQYRGKSRRRVLNLASHLNQGTALPSALEQTPKAVSRDAILMAWIGQITSNMAAALRLASSARSAQLPVWMGIASRLSYLLGLLLAMQVVVGFILYFIIPKFEAIFKDFGVPMPELTVLVVAGSHWIIQYGPIASLFFLAELGLLFYLPFSFSGWMNYNVPIFDRLLARRHSSLVLRALAMVIESNQPIARGLSCLANHYPTAWVRRRLSRVEWDVQQGADWIESLWRFGVIRRADAQVLTSAATVGNLGWALRELAETIERRQVMRLQALVQTLFPLVVVMVGLFVFILALAYFTPLVKLIWELSRTT